MFSRSSWPSWPSRPGYTLTELLAALLIMGVIAGALSVVYRGAPPANESPEKEALKLAQWLTNLATISNRTGRDFSLVCPGSAPRGVVEAVWRNPLKKDVYASAYGCKFNRDSGADAESLYSSQWSAMTPTITIRVSRGKVKHYVIVSRHGRVRTSRLPAAD
jgi:prepilin-type N-terminal cleavage/methylation domain-containing protein